MSPGPWPDWDEDEDRQTVWILAGGDAVDRQASFAAGQHVLQQLSQQPDIHVCPPVLLAVLPAVMSCHRLGGTLGSPHA